MIDPKLEILWAEHLKYERAMLNELTQIKFELQNARKLGEAQYKIVVPIPKKGFLARIFRR